MSMSKHTPGPWNIRRAQFPVDGEYDYAIYSDVDRVLAEVFGRAGQNIFPPAEANARLIAAAPDLLAAAKLIASFAVSWEPLTPGDIRMLTDAIAKAEGR